MPNVPPELVKQMKQLALSALGESAKLFAQKLNSAGVKEPEAAYKLLCSLTPNLPGVPPHVMLSEKYILIHILGKSGAVSDEMYTGMLKAVDPIKEMGLI